MPKEYFITPKVKSKLDILWEKIDPKVSGQSCAFLSIEPKLLIRSCRLCHKLPKQEIKCGGAGHIQVKKEFRVVMGVDMTRPQLCDGD